MSFAPQEKDGPIALIRLGPIVRAAASGQKAATPFADGTILMLSLIGFAQAAAPGAAAPDQTMAMLLQIAPLILIFVVFYFLLIRPQQQRMKAHQAMIAALKRGDVVVTSGGLIGKIKSVQEDEARVELGPNVEVRVLKHTIAEVRTKGEPAPANDTKSAKSGD
jgi:preprotein translocase subunit YajC